MSDRRERLDDDVVSLNVALEGFQAGLWTSMPVKVVSVAKLASQNTVNLQPTIMGKYRGPTDQTYSNFKMPILLDCPVNFPGGGPFVLTFPIAVGDEGLVLIANRCIDAWFASGADDNVQTEMRMHDLSDGFFLPGFRSRPHKVGSLNLTDVELRSFERNAFISIKPDNTITVETAGTANVSATTLTATANTITLNGPTTINGDVTVNGNITATGDITTVSGSITGATVWGTANLMYGMSPSIKSVGLHHHTGGTLTGGLTGNNV